MNYLKSDRIRLLKFADKFVTAEYVGWLNDSDTNRFLNVVGPNAGSCKVLEKNGFTLCGTQPQDYYLEGKYLDTHSYYKLREQHNV